jgi:AcrR family transcriptional regulator
MNDRESTPLERLWASHAESRRKPKVGLSLEQIVAAAIELADEQGLGAVSMQRVAQRLGFTTMSLYRYVASKDELLLLMQDTAWQPLDGLDVSGDTWRNNLARWCLEQRLILQRHPWLEHVRHIERAGTPSQLAWIDLGLRGLAATPLGEHEKVAILLVLSGYVFSEALQDAAVADGVRAGLFEPGESTAAFGKLLQELNLGQQFPALYEAVAGGAFAPTGTDAFTDFDFGLGLILDGVECFIKRRIAEARQEKQATPQHR